MTGNIDKIPFLKDKKSIKRNYDDDKEKELSDFLFEVSPLRVEKTEIKTKGWGGDAFWILFDEWMLLFQSNIVTNFLLFLSNNLEEFDYFFINKEFDNEKYKKILDTINDVM